MKDPQWHLLAYDIKSPRRLQKVHRILSKTALSIQKSVFLVLADEQEINRVLNLLATRINEKEDDIRTYPIESAQAIWSNGRKIAPDIIIEPKPKLNAWQRTKLWLATQQSNSKKIVSDDLNKSPI